MSIRCPKRVVAWLVVRCVADGRPERRRPDGCCTICGRKTPAQDRESVIDHAQGGCVCGPCLEWVRGPEKRAPSWVDTRDM